MADRQEILYQAVNRTRNMSIKTLAVVVSLFILNAKIRADFKIGGRGGVDHLPLTYLQRKLRMRVNGQSSADDSYR